MGDDAIIMDIIDLYAQRGKAEKTINVRYFYYTDADGEEFKRTLDASLKKYEKEHVSRDSNPYTTFTQIDLPSFSKIVNGGMPYNGMFESAYFGQSKRNILVINDDARNFYGQKGTFSQTLASSPETNAINISFVKSKQFYKD